MISNTQTKKKMKNLRSWSAVSLQGFSPNGQTQQKIKIEEKICEKAGSERKRIEFHLLLCIHYCEQGATERGNERQKESSKQQLQVSY